jgi:outer membrane protein OmpA-like peptidoglycan-associated protein
MLNLKRKGNNMKKIWPWLLLLLLLIIFCVWSKKDTIHVTSTDTIQIASSASIASEKEYISYTITQKDDDYFLEGHFSNDKQPISLATTFKDNSRNLAVNDTSINTALLGKEAIALTNTILPHFIKNYKNGKITYTNNVLRIYGDVTDYETQRQMQNLLNTSTLASQDHTNVIIEKPIHFSITKMNKNVDFTGTFNTQAQGKTLQAKLPQTANIAIKQATHLIDSGAVALTESILPSFIANYKSGKIEYANEVLTISGMVETEQALEEMKKLLAQSNLTIHNNTTIDPEALAKAAAAAEAIRQAEERAKQEKLKAEEEARKQAEERARLAEEAKLAEEKARLAQEAEEKAKLQKMQAKEDIKELLQVENIEFNVAKGSLTKKGIATVDKLANILLQHPHIKAEIAGHTDSDGSAIFNQKLSQDRVDSVKARLIEKGIDAARLTAKGYGESKPLVPNTSDENKQKNRRVEINIQGE